MEAGTGIASFREEGPIPFLGGDRVPRPVGVAALRNPQRGQGAHEHVPGAFLGKWKADGLAQPDLGVEESKPMHGLAARVRQVRDFPFDINGRERFIRDR
jgi:hypothetical protein